jgi:hypothetical protein
MSYTRRSRVILEEKQRDRCWKIQRRLKKTVPGGTFIAQTTPNWEPEEIREMDTFYREDLLSRKVSTDEVFACNPTLRTTQGYNMRPLLFRFQPRHVYRSHEN